MRDLAALILMVAAFPLPAAASDILRYASTEQAFAVNSWIVPTRTGIVVVDTQFTVPAAEALLAAVSQTGKPLRGIVITHPHPDHYNGTCALLQVARVPVYATQSTIDGIRATADAKRAQWKPSYGKDYPDATCGPDQVLPLNGSTTIDGVVFESRDYGPGEALAETVLRVPALRAALVGDLIYDEVHPWLAEGRSVLWLAQLDRLVKDIPSDWTVYPGHGAAADIAVISAQRSYIADFRAETRARLGSGPLSKEAAQALVSLTRAQHPGWPLEMLIAINADAVAREFNPPSGK